MIQLEQREDVDPVCPYCERTLRTISYQGLSGFFGKRYVYFCPGCRAALGFSHRKGFWMG